MDNFVSIITDLGVPVSVAVAAGAGLFLMVKFLQKNMTSKLDGMYTILVKLIDRVQDFRLTIGKTKQMIEDVYSLKSKKETEEEIRKIENERIAERVAYRQRRDNDS